MRPQDFERQIKEPLNEIQRYATLTDIAQSRMRLAKDTFDVPMYKFWKRQYWIAASAHSQLLKQFYLED